MRLWHQKLISYLPRQQLLGQHRECCALRGAGWGRKHSVVNYVFTHSPNKLIAYHFLIMDEMIRRGYKPDPIWKNPNWRGLKLGEQKEWGNISSIEEIYLKSINSNINIYTEHDNKYLKECLDNLSNKNINIDFL